MHAWALQHVFELIAFPLEKKVRSPVCVTELIGHLLYPTPVPSSQLNCLATLPWAGTGFQDDWNDMN